MGSDEGRKPRDDPRRNPAFLLFLALATSSTVALFFSLLPTPSPSPHTLSSTTNLLSSRSSSSISSPPLPLVVILVTPSPVEGPGSRFDRLKVIHQTWGSRQPAHVKVLFTTDSLKEDGGNGVLPSSSFLLLPEAYPPKDNMHRIQYSLEEGSRLFPMAEFFLVCNDHTFIIPENLLCYLSTYRDASPSTSTTTTTPLFLGHRLTTTEGTSFHSGGAGFVLNRAATDALLSALTAPKPAPNCQAHNEWEAINAGVTMAKCLTYTLEIPPQIHAMRKVDNDFMSLARQGLPKGKWMNGLLIITRTFPPSLLSVWGAVQKILSLSTMWALQKQRLSTTYSTTSKNLNTTAPPLMSSGRGRCRK